jgi:hypothetical protein
MSGQGDGSVDYVAAANPSAEPRRGTLVVGGQVVEVVQEGLACQFQVQPTGQSVGAEGGSGSFTVESPSGCNWTPAASADWITVTNTGSRSGNGSVSFTVAANTGNPRDGTISIGSQTFTIEQAAPSCRYQLSANTASFGGAGGSGTVNVTAASACAWTASTNVPWISIVGDASDTGNGTVSFTVQPNSGPARNGILTIGGQRFTVAQLQADCNYSISSAGQSYAASGGQGTVTVSTNSICTWNTSEVPSWVRGMAASGTGQQILAFTVDANQGPARSAVISIAGQTFTLTQAGGCSYSLAPTSHNSTAGGGASSVAVNTAPGCTWTTSGVPAWITGVPASGTGPQSVNFSVAANASVARSANLLIAGQAFAVSQQGGCSYSLTPTSYGPPAGGGSSSVAVNTAPGCTWTTSGVPTWITGVPASGTGPQSINFSVAANASVARSANLLIAGQAFTVSQQGGCSYSLTPTSYGPPAGGGSSSFAVNTAAGCGWTSSGVPAWVTGVPASGTGPQTINFTVAANPGGARSASVLIGGHTFGIIQAAVACNYSLSPASHSATAGGGASAFDVNTASSCGWTSGGVPAWITGVPASGTGTTTINFTVAANPDPSPRDANITIGGQTFNVAQAAAACNYSLSPTSHSATASGGASAFDVNTTSSCSWTSGGVPAWITGVPASGTGTTTINFTVAANPDSSPRNANITIAGQTFSVAQAAAACNYSLSPSSHSATASGGASAFDINTTASCSWTSSGVPGWITGVPASGTGTTTINFTVAANSEPSSRNANITIGGQTFSVTQAAAACTYSVNPTSHNATAAGGSSTFDVDTTAGCNWTSSGVPAWISGIPASGTGPTTINFSVAANTGPARSVNVSVQSQTFAVTQASGCTYDVTPAQLTFDVTGAPAQEITLTTATGCTWTATANRPWITILSGSSGIGSGTIRVILLVNGDLAVRQGAVTVEGRTVTITQNP